MWKNLLMHPVNGLFAHAALSAGMQPVEWFSQTPLLAIILLVSWQWLPFAGLILLTAMQSLDEEQQDAAAMDGASSWPFFVHIVLPHLARPIAAVVLIETVFLLAIFAEILVTTGGGPGVETTNLAFLVLRAGAFALRRGRGFRRRGGGGGAGKYCRVFSDAAGGEKSGGGAR